MRRIALVMIMFLIGLSMLYAGPFGLEFGWTERDMIDAGIETGEKFPGDYPDGGKYFVSPPKPYPGFDAYVVSTYEDVGIYNIIGSAVFHTVSGSGDELIHFFELLEAQLEDVYGEGARTDELAYGSEFQEEDEFMKGLFAGDRLLNTIWMPEPESGTGIYMILLEIVALSEDAGAIFLRYYGENLSDVFRSLAAADLETLDSVPFGLDYGWSEADMVAAGTEIISDSGAFLGVTSYSIYPPNPNSNLDMYNVDIDDEYGLFRIVGRKYVECSSFAGEELISEYEYFVDQFAFLYGEGASLNHIDPDSTLASADSFMLSLVFGDRTMFTMWELDNGVNSEGVTAMIIVEPVAIDPDTGLVDLIYFSDYEVLVDERVQAFNENVL